MPVRKPKRQAVRSKRAAKVTAAPRRPEKSGARRVARNDEPPDLTALAEPLTPELPVPETAPTLSQPTPPPSDYERPRYDGDTAIKLYLREIDRKSTRLNSSHLKLSRMPSSA